LQSYRALTGCNKENQRADSLAMMLRLLGDEDRIDQDGVEAIEVAERFRPQVIPMDVGMPPVSGLDATRRIREKEGGQGITIIALTGRGQDGDRERLQERGYDCHPGKPVILSELDKVLAEGRAG
jgi:CheY-like chemotaxis protein